MAGLPEAGYETYRDRAEVLHATGVRADESTCAPVWKTALPLASTRRPRRRSGPIAAERGVGNLPVGVRVSAMALAGEAGRRHRAPLPWVAMLQPSCLQMTVMAESPRHCARWRRAVTPRRMPSARSLTFAERTSPTLAGGYWSCRSRSGDHGGRRRAEDSSSTQPKTPPSGNKVPVEVYAQLLAALEASDDPVFGCLLGTVSTTAENFSMGQVPCEGVAWPKNWMQLPPNA
jgi:hypothetical protein